MDQQKRNMGIELFRVLCMLGIVCYHLLGYGWIIQQLHPMTWKHDLARVLESIGICGVTGFALISGYAGAQGRTRCASLALLWLRVWLYSVGLTLLAAWIMPDVVAADDLRAAFLPTLHTQYWYFTAYVGCFAMTPFIKAGLQRMSKRQATTGVALMLLIFCVLGQASGYDLFGVRDGRSVVWLIVMYMLGAYLKTFDVLRDVPTWMLAVLAALGVALQAIGAFFGMNRASAPTAVFMNVMLMLLLTRMPVKRGEKLIALLGASSFSVYLIHDHPYVRMMTISRYAGYLANAPKALFIPAVVLAAAGIYLLCVGVDLLRVRMFAALHIRERLYALEDKWLGAD